MIMPYCTILHGKSIKLLIKHPNVNIYLTYQISCYCFWYFIIILAPNVCLEYQSLCLMGKHI